MMENVAMVQRAQVNEAVSDTSTDHEIRSMYSQLESKRSKPSVGERRSFTPMRKDALVGNRNGFVTSSVSQAGFVRVLQAKPAAKTTAPGWDQLPELAKTELGSRNYHKRWYEDSSRTDEQRQAVLNLYVKMRGMGLWDYVTHRDKVTKSSLNFRSASLDDLKAKLRERDDFTTPDESSTKWESREKRARGSLHIKHWGAFTEAHIDPTGFRFRSSWWWAMPLIPLALMVLHGIDYSGYENPFRVRDILLSQGWWKEPLLGKGVASTYSGKPSSHSAITPPEEIRLEMGRLQHQGQPMDDEMRRPYESYFNHDFSLVRVHTDEKFGGIARSLGLEAFTIGNAIVFGTGQYAPHSRRGKALMAHELAHVRQQNRSSQSGSTNHNIETPGSPRAEAQAEFAELDFLTKQESGQCRHQDGIPGRMSGNESYTTKHAADKP